MWIVAQCFSVNPNKRAIVRSKAMIIIPILVFKNGSFKFQKPSNVQFFSINNLFLGFRNSRLEDLVEL